MNPCRRRVLVLGAYFVDRETRILQITEELSRSREWDVEQRWVALGAAVPPVLASCTVATSAGCDPKFTLMNRQLAQIDARHAYVIVADDDIALPPGFLDAYLGHVERYGFALAQPARTCGSFTDHHFVTQLLGVRARRTRFVEIGPLFSIRADALPVLTPFDEESPMGWGYDFVWPVQIEAAGLAMGIVDATPVAHDLRKPVTTYRHAAAAEQMAAFLATRPHLDPLQAFQIVRSYA